MSTLDKLDALMKAATEGEWRAGMMTGHLAIAVIDENGGALARLTPIIPGSSLPWTDAEMSPETRAQNRADAECIAAAHNALADLLAIARAAANLATCLSCPFCGAVDPDDDEHPASCVYPIALRLAEARPPIEVP
ncbi:MAG: hypothetical protein ABI445_24210 [Polyangia bacterium]